MLEELAHNYKLSVDSIENNYSFIRVLDGNKLEKEIIEETKKSLNYRQ